MWLKGKHPHFNKLYIALKLSNNLTLAFTARAFQTLFQALLLLKHPQYIFILAQPLCNNLTFIT